MPTEGFALVEQYGSFGLLAAIMLWGMFKTIPGMMESFKAALAAQVALSEKSEKECREERLALAAAQAAEREKDRLHREKFLVALASRGLPIAEHRQPDV